MTRMKKWQMTMTKWKRMTKITNNRHDRNYRIYRDHKNDGNNRWQKWKTFTEWCKTRKSKKDLFFSFFHLMRLKSFWRPLLPETLGLLKKKKKNQLYDFLLPAVPHLPGKVEKPPATISGRSAAGSNLPLWALKLESHINMGWVQPWW